MVYKECRKKFLEKILREFKEKKLKQRDNKIITDRKQAIAIALSIAQDKCKHTQKDLQEVEAKVNEFLSSKEVKKISLTSLIETQVLIDNFIKMKKYKKARFYISAINILVFKALKDNIKVSKNIINILIKINKYI